MQKETALLRQPLRSGTNIDLNLKTKIEYQLLALLL